MANITGCYFIIKCPHRVDCSTPTSLSKVLCRPSLYCPLTVASVRCSSRSASFIAKHRHANTTTHLIIHLGPAVVEQRDRALTVTSSDVVPLDTSIVRFVMSIISSIYLVCGLHLSVACEMDEFPPSLSLSLSLFSLLPPPPLSLSLSLLYSCSHLSRMWSSVLHYAHHY